MFNPGVNCGDPWEPPNEDDYPGAVTATLELPISADDFDYSMRSDFSTDVADVLNVDASRVVVVNWEGSGSAGRRLQEASSPTTLLVDWLVTAAIGSELAVTGAAVSSAFAAPVVLDFISNAFAQVPVSAVSEDAPASTGVPTQNTDPQVLVHARAFLVYM